MPLVTWAYVAVAAGLLMGSGGAVFPALAAAVVLALVAFPRRSLELASLAGLAVVGVLTGWSVAQADSACATAVEKNGYATIRLREDAKAGSGARGFVLGKGCRVAVRIRVVNGRAPAGATVFVRGVARREGARVSISDARIHVERNPGLLARWRAKAGATIDALYGEQAPLARALLIADERDISPGIRRQFADSGIIHMLSVSGLHVAVLAEGVVLVLMVAGTSTRRAEGVATITIAVFVLFVGAPSPAVRSAAMYAAVVLSRRFQRPTSPWALLALGAALPLIQPRVVNEIGYHLSIAGMAGLIASGKLTRRLPLDRLPEWGRRLARETIATLVASAVTGADCRVAFRPGEPCLAHHQPGGGAPVRPRATGALSHAGPGPVASRCGSSGRRDARAADGNRKSRGNRRGDPGVGDRRAAERGDGTDARGRLGIPAGGVRLTILGTARDPVCVCDRVRVMVAADPPDGIAARGPHDRRRPGRCDCASHAAMALDPR